MIKLPRMESGIDIINHSPQEGAGSIFWIAIIFCGEEMGDAIPPKLDANAIPMIKQGANLESEGKVRRIGYHKQ